MALQAEEKLLLACARCLSVNRVPSGRLGVRFAELDTEQAQAVAARFGIRSIPTMILFRGGREAARTAGAMDARRIRSWLESQLGGRDSRR